MQHKAELNPPVEAKTFQYYVVFIREYLYAIHLALNPGTTRESFIIGIYEHMLDHEVEGDGMLKDCIAQNALGARELVIVACAYCTQAVKAESAGQHHIAWTYLTDAQLYLGSAAYAAGLYKDLPTFESAAIDETLKDLKREAGKARNARRTEIAEEAVRLVKELGNGEDGMPVRRWKNPTEMARAIKPKLWPFILKKEPKSSEAAYEATIARRLKDQVDEVEAYLLKKGQKKGEPR